MIKLINQFNDAKLKSTIWLIRTVYTPAKRKPSVLWFSSQFQCFKNSCQWKINTEQHTVRRGHA